MKKRIIKLFMVVGVLSLASSAFAARTFDSTGSSIGGGTFKTSTSVVISAESNGTNYAATAAHTKGSKQYGTLSSDPKIAVNDTDKPTDSGPIAVTSATALPNANFK